MNDSQRIPGFQSFVRRIQPSLFARRYPDLRVRVEPKTEQILNELKGCATVICPNHSRHEDGELMFLFSILTKQPVKFLAAREMFRTYLGLGGVVLRALGCYEVDRGATNAAAVKSVEERLVTEASKVVIFPEGEISYDNSALEKFEHGAAAIALESSLLLREQQSDEDVFILPLAISYQFEDASSVCTQILDQLERRMNLPADQEPLYSRARRICEMYVESLKTTVSIDDGSRSFNSIDEQVESIVKVNLKILARELNCALPETSQLHQIHFLQSRIFGERKKTGFLQRGRLNMLYIETLNLVRLRSISSKKFATGSSLNSLADLLCNLQVLIVRKQFRSAQHAILSACDPVPCRKFLVDFEKDRDGTIEVVTSMVANRIQSRLNELRVQSVDPSIPVTIVPLS